MNNLIDVLIPDSSNPNENDPLDSDYEPNSLSLSSYVDLDELIKQSKQSFLFLSQASIANDIVISSGLDRSPFRQKLSLYELSYLSIKSIALMLDFSPHPGGNEYAYVNRKGFHSINMKGVCNHRGRFMQINNNWPGSCHDSFIFRASNLSTLLGASHRFDLDGVLLGDSGYACRKNLVTPYLNPITQLSTQITPSLFVQIGVL
ncbi:putative nuclease HARBI1 [Nymphon striatum]|nr:putative nuclease HARBI1 [Nymphon striatum]